MKKLVKYLFIFLLIFAFIGVLIYGIVEEEKIKDAPIENAIVIDKLECDGYLYAKILCETTIDGKLRSYSKKVPLSIAEYRSISVGDAVEFDEYNEIILIQ